LIGVNSTHLLLMCNALVTQKTSNILRRVNGVGCILRYKNSGPSCVMQTCIESDLTILTMPIHK